MRYPLAVLCICLLANQAFPRQEDPETELRSLLLDDRFEEVLQRTATGDWPDSLTHRVLYYRGKAYQSLFNYDSAYQCYRQAALLDSSIASYRVSMGQMLAKLGRNREAIRVYEALCNEKSPDKQHLAELAALYSLQKEFSRSLEICLELLEKDSLNYHFLKQAGRMYQELGLADSALQFFETAFEQNAADAYLTHQIANIYLKKKDLDKALSSIQRGFIHDSTNLDLLKLRGYIWLLSHEYLKAIRDLENARIRDSSSVFIQKYLGLSYHEVKMFDQARRALERAFTLDSSDAETAFFLGSASRWSRFEEDGVYYFNKSIELQQPDPGELKNVYVQLAELYRVLHRFDEALESYDRAVECDPADNTLYFKIGQIYDRSLDRKRMAIEYYEKYLESGKTGHQLFNLEEGTSTALEQHVRERIDRLKEELFMEE